MCNRAGKNDFRAWNSTKCQTGDYVKSEALLCYYWLYVSSLYFESQMKILSQLMGFKGAISIVTHRPLNKRDRVEDITSEKLL